MIPDPRTPDQIERDAALDTVIVKAILAVLDERCIDDGHRLSILGCLYAAEALSCDCSLKFVLNAMRQHYRMMEKYQDEPEETLQ